MAEAVIMHGKQISIINGQNNLADGSTSVDEHHLLEKRKNFGAWIRDCRRKSNVTQAGLAHALGYDSSQLISNIERGVSLLPSRRLHDFAKVLGISPLEMEIRYFQCSARTSTESRMPELLLKYLPIIEKMEADEAGAEKVLSALRAAGF